MCVCKVEAQCLHQLCPFYFLRPGLLTKPVAQQLARLAGQFAPVLITPTLGLQVCAPCSSFLHTCWGSNLKSAHLSSKHFAIGAISPALSPQHFCSSFQTRYENECLKACPVCNELRLTYPSRIVLTVKHPPYDGENKTLKFLWLVVPLMNVGGK